MDYSFLKDYKISESQTPTIFEIAHFPQRENVYSNVLAFFLSKKYESTYYYVLKNVLFKMLKKDDENIIRVVREESTTKKKRIDIYIETESELIVIENKINAKLYNDLEHYEDYANRYGSFNGKKVRLVILSKDEIHNAKYQCITYKQLVTEVTNQDIPINMNTVYDYLFMDFVKTIENHANGVDSMLDNDFYSLLLKNGIAINDLIKKYNEHMNYCNERANKTIDEMKSWDLKNEYVIGYWAEDDMKIAYLDLAKNTKNEVIFDIVHTPEYMNMNIRGKGNNDFIEKAFSGPLAKYKDDFDYIDKRFFYTQRVLYTDYYDGLAIIKNLIRDLDGYIYDELRT